MEKIIDGMLYTFGGSVIILPIFYFGSLQLMKYKKEIVSSSMDHFTNNLFGNIFQKPTPAVIANAPVYEKDVGITSFFLKKKGI